MEILDYLAGALILYGNWLKIQKKAIGWLFSMIAIGYYILRAHSLGLNGQSFWHVVSFFMAFAGWWSWRKQ